MDSSKTVTFPSETFAGVSFTLRKPSYGAGLELDDMTREFRSAVAIHSKRHRALVAQLDEQKALFERERRLKIEELKKAAADPDVNATDELAKLEEATYEIPEALGREFGEISQDSLRIMARLYNPQLFRWGFRGIENYTIEGVVPDADQMLMFAPPELTSEIVAKIEQIKGMTEAEIKNLLSPTTSVAPVGEETSDTTAISAKSKDSTSAGTAESTSLNS